MDRPRILVDFNELVTPNLLLLSKKDIKQDSDGNDVSLSEGIRVHVYEIDCDDDGRPAALVAEGIVELNDPAINGHWTKAVKWCCRIDAKGIYHLPSEVLK